MSLRQRGDELTSQKPQMHTSHPDRASDRKGLKRVIPECSWVNHISLKCCQDGSGLTEPGVPPVSKETRPPDHSTLTVSVIRIFLWDSGGIGSYFSDRMLSGCRT